MPRSIRNACRTFVASVVLFTGALLSQSTCVLPPPNPPLPPELDGVLPIPVLGNQVYKDGQTGGLYPGGENEPPVSYRPTIRSFRDQIIPLSASGIDCDLDPLCDVGLIGMLSIGFSNPTHEFGAFVHQENTNAERNAHVVLVSGSQGGQHVKKITCSDPSFCTLDQNESNDYWKGVADKVANAGLTPEQVQVAWVKSTVQGPEGEFLEAAGLLREEIEEILRLLRVHYPNVQIAYVASRIYGGYKDGGSPEPYAYEEGFAHKWLIEDQIDGSDPGLDTSVVPLVLWGPYIWANADLAPYDGLVWCPEDFEKDGDNQHPDELGEQKVADRLSDFFATDPSAKTWWNRAPDAETALTVFTPTDDAYVFDDGSPCGSGFGDHSRLLVSREPSFERRAFVRFDYSAESRPILRAFLGFRVDPGLAGSELEASGPANVFLVDGLDEGWSEDTVDWCTQPGVTNPANRIARTYSRSAYVTIDVTNAVVSQGDGVVSFRLDADTAVGQKVRSYMSKELEPGSLFAFPPQLTLVVDDAAISR